MQRIPLILEDACMDGVRELARRQNRTISEVVNDLLTDGLQRRRAAKLGEVAH